MPPVVPVPSTQAQRQSALTDAPPRIGPGAGTHIDAASSQTSRVLSPTRVPIANGSPNVLLPAATAALSNPGGQSVPPRKNMLWTPPATLEVSAQKSHLETSVTRDAASHPAVRNFDLQPEVKPLGRALEAPILWKAMNSYHRLLEIGQDQTEGVWGPPGAAIGEGNEQRVLTVLEGGSIGATAVQPGLKEMKQLSAVNLLRLKNQVGELSETERHFLDALNRLPMFATHATNATLEPANYPGLPEYGKGIRLFSRLNLERRGVRFDENHTTPDDRKRLRNDDFVFFSIEIGHSPKKPSSLFGQTMYRFPMAGNPLFKSLAWASLGDMIKPAAPHPQAIISKIGKDDLETLRARRIGGPDLVFLGTAHIREGLGLALIRDLRQLHETSKQALLAFRGEDAINNLVYGMFRPELKVPREFFGRPSEAVEVQDLGGSLAK